MRLPQGTVLQGAAVALVLAVAGFLALNLAIGLAAPMIRLDFTADRLYTLSPVTRSILKSLPEPIHLRFYASRRLLDSSGQFASYQSRVRQLLDVYRDRAHGKITLEIIDPEPYSVEEDRALGFGLRGIPLDGQGGQAFFGLVATNSTDAAETLPFLAPDREAFLEYDLTRLLSTLSAPKKQIVGLLDGGKTGRSAPWAAVEQARQLFTVQDIDPKASVIDPSLSVLMIIQPRDLSAATQFAIDQFVLGGGSALIFVDPDAESIAARPPVRMDDREVPGDGPSSLPLLFKAWGIGFDTDKIVADWDQAMRIQAESFGRPVATGFPPYIAVKAPYLSADDPVTGNLKMVDLITAGSLTKLADADTRFMPMIVSSPHSSLARPIDGTALADPMGFDAKYQQTNQQYTLAARVTGSFSTAFPGGPPASGAKAAGPWLKASAKPAQIIVVADVDMLSDRTWTNVGQEAGQRVAVPFAGNGDFVINALENLSGSPTLASLRGRGLVPRALTRIEDLQRTADSSYLATEEALSRKLEHTRRQLLLLAPSAVNPAAPLLTEDQQATLRQFRAEMNQTRIELRDVQLQLRHSIDRLETGIRLINIAVMPMAVILFALLRHYGGSVSWAAWFSRLARCGRRHE